MVGTERGCRGEQVQEGALTLEGVLLRRRRGKEKNNQGTSQRGIWLKCRPATELDKEKRLLNRMGGFRSRGGGKRA